MAKSSPDFTLANNSHCLIHAGPLSDDVKDPGNELLISTASKAYSHWNKNGTKTESVEGRWTEESGHNIKEDGAIARAICAKNGDIHLNADYGDIYLKARNIYIETTGPRKGGNSHGNFLVTANGHIVLVGNDNVKIASGGQLCLNATAKISLVAPDICSSGQIKDSGPFSATGIISKIKAGNYAALLQGILQSCK